MEILMKKNLSRTILLTSCATFILSSCELLKMPKNTTEMKVTTEKMKTTMEDMKEGTEALFYQNRSKETQETRDRSIKNLDELETFEAKVTEAAVFYKAFEYQVWTNRPAKGDTHIFREELMLEATEELFRVVAEQKYHVDDLDDMSPTDDDSASLNMYALSVALHKNHTFQKNLVKREGITEYSMFKMIKQALSKREKVNSGKVNLHGLKEWEQEILDRHTSATLLLKSRYQILSAMTLNKVSPLSKEKGITKSTKGLYQSFFGWKSLYTNLDVAEKEKANLYIKSALEVREYLKSININIQLDSRIKTLFEKMEPLQTDCETEVCAKNIHEENNTFQELVNKLINQ
jgi:hypothetical protein